MQIYVKLIPRTPNGLRKHRIEVGEIILAREVFKDEYGNQHDQINISDSLNVLSFSVDTREFVNGVRCVGAKLRKKKEEKR